MSQMDKEQKARAQAGNDGAIFSDELAFIEEDATRGSGAPAEDDDLMIFDDEDSAPLPVAGAHQDSAIPPAQTRLILMVDDDPQVHAATLLALGGALAGGGKLAFAHAHSAKEAREWLLAQPLPDLVCMDMMMESALAGIELAAWMKADARLKAIPILLRSGQSGLAGEMERVRELGVEGIASKGSMTRDGLLDLIGQLLSGEAQSAGG